MIELLGCNLRMLAVAWGLVVRFLQEWMKEETREVNKSFGMSVE